MAGVNKVILVGNLGRDPEARNMSNGGKVVTFSLATSETWKDKEGQRQEKTQWHRVAIFNEKIGEIAERFLRKGSKVYLEGALESRKYQDKEGQERETFEVVLGRFKGELTLLDSKGEGNGAAQSAPSPVRSNGGGYGAPRAARQAPSAAPDLNDDIPF